MSSGLRRLRATLPHARDRALFDLIVETQREITASDSDVDAATQLVRARCEALAGADGTPRTERHGQAIELLSVLLSAAVAHAHDAVTGLPNRLGFRQRIQQAVADGEADGEFTVVIIDLDRFKEINDSMGHHAGDALLVEVARRVEGALRTSDMVARLGGDEFGLLLGAPTGPAGLETVLHLVREAIEEPIVLHDLPLAISSSMGVAT